MKDDATPAVEAIGLGLAVGDGVERRWVLADCDLRVDAGELVAIVGASGSGKTTLLHLLAGIERPTLGTVRVAGRQLGALGDDACTVWRRRRIGIVFQAFHLLPALDVLENVGLPLLLDGVARAVVRTRARTALAAVGLDGIGGAHLGRLSGGELQRVAVARALVGEPAVLLADEPTGSLDAVTAGRVLEALLAACRARRQTTLLVTHDPAIAARAHRTLVLEHGQLVHDATGATDASARAPHSRLPPAAAAEKVTDAA